MSDKRQNALSYAHQHQEQFLKQLNGLLTIPSISTLTDHAQDMHTAAEYLAEILRSLDIANVQIFPTETAPVVYGEVKVDASKPTVLIYGHYDVQPVDPLNLWESEPFSPQVRGDNLYARGASDMKGQIIATLSALKSIKEQGGYPVNLKFMFEGEEEIGSPHLTPFMLEHKDLLACDLALIPDTEMIAADIPTLTYGLRGLAYFELRVYGPDHDLHSGVHGGVVHNPAQVLCDLVSKMHDEHGRVTLPGFYDKVLPLEADERTAFAKLPITDETFIEQTGVKALWGEEGYTAVERVSSRPTLEVCGMLSGFTGEGSKTVLPAWAMVKISSRLVPWQDPDEVFEQLKQFIETNAPQTVRWELFKYAGGPASLTDRNGKGCQSMARALETVWHTPTLFKKEGGSVPIVGDIQRILKADSVLTGFSLPEDRVHSPNEKLHLPTWTRGIDALIHFFYNLAENTD